MIMSVNWRLLVLLVILLLVLTPAVGAKRRLSSPLQSSEQFTLRMPSLWGRVAGGAALLATSDGHEFAKLRIATFESPVLLLPDSGGDQVICVYDNDVSVESIVFSLRARAANQDVEIPDEVKTVVLQSSVGVRMARAEEVEYAIATISQMTEDEFAAYSVPTVDFGVLRLYGSRSNIVDRLTQSLTAFRGDGRRQVL